MAKPSLRALGLGVGCAIALSAAGTSPALAAVDASPLSPAPLAPALVAPVLADAGAEADLLAQLRADYERKQAELAAQAEAERTDKVLAYDPALIAQIGNQADGGHPVCCPGYACAYGDAVLYGEARDHAAYGCGSCTWPGWGGGNSSFRSLGSDEALLREAYDEIAAGRPTVVHVAGPYGEHWICLIGYRGAADPDALTLDNFVALDPANGQEVVASYRYVPYGDACQHVSDLSA